MADGTLLFEVSTPTGGWVFTIKTGDLKTEAMVKLVFYAYDKQVPVWVFYEKDPHVATDVVVVTL